MALDGDYDRENIFAKILRGEAPCHRVFENDTAIAFMDLFPQSDGHTLVVPRAAARNILDIAPEDLSAVVPTVQRVAKAVRTAMQPDGVIVTQFNGAPAGQTVFHLHFHVIPVYGDQTARPHASGKQADADTLAANARKIAAAIA